MFVSALLSLLFSVIPVILYIVYIVCKLFMFNMNPEEAKFLRTNRKPGTLDVHTTQNAIILNYELEVHVLGDVKNVLCGEKRDMRKIISIPNLNSRSDCNAIAKEVLAQCDLIHPSRLVEVEQMIYYLKKRKNTNATNDDNELLEKSFNADLNTANINSLHEYIELLYEEMPDKIKASYLILNLAKDADNLDSLSKNETALSALARVLREDWKRNVVLTTNLIYTFFCFSAFSDFHHVILQYKIGSLCMDIIDYELRRYDEWKADLQGVKHFTEPPIVRKSYPTSASMFEIQRSRIPEPVRPKSGYFEEINQKSSLDVSTDDDLTISSENLEEKEKLTEAEKIKKYRTLIKKQEHVLRVAFYLLLNIAEDETVEEKMSKRNIVGLLIKALERDNEELLTLVVTFLKKMSIVDVNKDEMLKMDIVKKIGKTLQSTNVDLVHLSLKLLFNLSFDAKLRSEMVENGFMHKFVSLLKDDRHQDVVIKLLYHLSYDKEHATQFVYTDCVSLITDMLLLSSGDHVDIPLVALCINLATCAENAQQMIENTRLHSLISKAFLYQNVLLMKIIRNISEHEVTKSSFIEFVGDIAKAATDSKNEDFFMECFGVLSNLHIAELDWAEIFKHFDLIPRIKALLECNNVQADVVLQVVVLIGTAAYDEGCATMMCKSHIIDSAINLLKVYQEDDEIVLQIMYMFVMMLAHEFTADYIVKNTEVPAYIIDLLLDSNDEIRKICNSCLNIIAERSSEWGERIRIERFRSHNAQWLQMVDSQSLGPEEEEDDDELPPYLNKEYLSTATIPKFTEEDKQANLELDEIDEFEGEILKTSEMNEGLALHGLM